MPMPKPATAWSERGAKPRPRAFLTDPPRRLGSSGAPDRARGAGMNVAQYAEALASFIDDKVRARALHRLTYLFWECTLRCNLSCRHCGSDCVKDRASAARELPAEVVCRELSSIARVLRSAGKSPSRSSAASPCSAATSKPSVPMPRLSASPGASRPTACCSTPVVWRRSKAAGLSTDLGQPRRSGRAARRLAAAPRRLSAGDGGHPAAGGGPVLGAFRRHLLRQRSQHRSSRAVHRPSGGARRAAVRFTPVFSRGRADAESGLMLSGEQLRRMLAFVAEQRAAVGTST